LEGEVRKLGHESRRKRDKRNRGESPEKDCLKTANQIRESVIKGKRDEKKNRCMRQGWKKNREESRKAFKVKSSGGGKRVNASSTLRHIGREKGRLKGEDAVKRITCVRTIASGVGAERDRGVREKAKRKGPRRKKTNRVIA